MIVSCCKRCSGCGRSADVQRACVYTESIVWLREMCYIAHSCFLVGHGTVLDCMQYLPEATKHFAFGNSMWLSPPRCNYVQPGPTPPSPLQPSLRRVGACVAPPHGASLAGAGR